MSPNVFCGKTNMTIFTKKVVRSKKELLESEQRMIQLIRQNELVLNNINSGLAYIANDYIVQWENISLCSKKAFLMRLTKGELLLSDGP